MRKTELMYPGEAWAEVKLTDVMVRGKEKLVAESSIFLKISQLRMRKSIWNYGSIS